MSFRVADAPPIGIAGVSTELSEYKLTSDVFSKMSDIPQQIVEQKLGIKQILRWGEGDPDAAAFRCAWRALAGLDPRELDMIISIVHPPHPEQELYGYGSLLKQVLGAENAEVLDVDDTCASITLAMQLARNIFVSEPHVQHILLAGVVTLGDLVNLSNDRTTWMANLSDGAGAMLLSRNPKLDNVLLETAQRCDPQFIDDVGSVSPYLPEPISYKQRFRRFLPVHLDVIHKEHMKERLDKVSLPNYQAVIRDSLIASGLGPHDVDLIGTNTMKPSMWNALLAEFKLEPRTQMYLSDVGHVGFIDQFLYVQRTREHRRLPQGGVLVLSTAGVGFHWTATTIAFKGPRLEALA